MASVHDVAAYILRQQGGMTAMKLQKLCYYSQAWSLVWDDRSLFDDRIEAWANGPVAPSLYAVHRGQFRVDETLDGLGDPAHLDQDAIDTIDAVLHFYGGKSAVALSDLTHRESPWREARGELPAGARGCTEITQEAMAEYYGALFASRDD